MIKGILADADGTLITGGKLDRSPAELIDAVRHIRERGILFNLASGRPHFEQLQIWQHLVGAEAKPQEAILSEGALLQFHNDNKVYNTGGLTREEITAINAYLRDKNLDEGMVPQNNNDKYQAQTGRVTPSFILEGVTNKALLKAAYRRIKPAIEAEFPGVEVCMSADAVDIFKAGVTKAGVTRKYSEVTGIPLHELAAIGDSGNDMPMLREIGINGGLAIYVGENPEQREIVMGYKNNFIPVQTGPLGTVEALDYILGGI